MKKEYEEPFFEIFKLEITDDLLDESAETNERVVNAGAGTGNSTGYDTDFFED